MVLRCYSRSLSCYTKHMWLGQCPRYSSVYYITSCPQRKRLFSTSYPNVKDKPSELLPLPLAPPTQHNSLATFLAYAKSVNLQPSTTTFVGTRYEYTVLSSLRRLGFDLVRTGGRADKGIDLLGYWYLPGLTGGNALRVLLQCKALSRKASPNVIRELEGAFAGARGVKWMSRTAARDDEYSDEGHVKGAVSHNSVMVLLVTPQQATKGVRDAMSGSRYPMAYLKISQDGLIEQLLWNRTASERGLGDMSVVTRHIPKLESGHHGSAHPHAENEIGDDAVNQEQEENMSLKQPKVMKQEVVMMSKGEAWDWPLAESNESRMS